jgi:flagellin
MVEIGNNLQRIRELSVQSANATNSDSDREALNAEVKQLTSEIDRVSRQTNFNGTKLLDGSFSGALFQIGADSGQTIGINSIVNASTSTLGNGLYAAKQTATAVAGTGTATAAGKVSGFEINGETIADVAVAVGDKGADVAKKVVNAINDKMDQTGVYASLNAAGNMELTSLKSGKALEFNGGTSDAAGLAIATTGLADADANAGAAVSGVDISSIGGAQKALSIVDDALKAVNSSRADMGAIQNRFTSTIANLNTTSENLSASRSRIRDTDYAKETAELTRTQILQQAGTAMLAQANQSPSSVMSLLQG